MKTISYHLFLVFIFLIALNGCKTKKNISQGRTSESIVVFQNGNATSFAPGSHTIELQRKEFSIRFLNKAYDPVNKKFYTAQIAAFRESAEIHRIKAGMKKNDVDCFKFGSGMAANESGGYEALLFNNKGHHYLYYANAKNNRLNLIEKRNDLLNLEFPIQALYLDKKDIPLAQSTISVIYLAVLIDRNLNNVIDKGELTKLKIKLN